MTVTGIISALIIGLIVGALGRLVVPGRQNIPMWLTMLIGVGAALLGSAIARAAGVVETAGVDWIEIFIQVALAALGVALTVGLAGRRSIT
ncbi:MAG TPA: GlsB/YeaQ/YmgE family stress response membrane protein [Micromonosporaceae bacterium]|nr:GlsB/YeaQ/YmgE family stress response membrane protein [Micromonosporaceae bacterium]